MKEFKLSTLKERVVSTSFSAAIIVCFGFLLYALRGNVVLLMITALFTLLVGAFLVFYVISVWKSCCVLDTENRILEVKGYPSYTKDLSKAVLVQTVERKNSQTVSRALVFSDAEENTLAVVPTLFTYKQGALADPLAKEMADALGIDFKENVPAWYYDKDKFKEHQKEEAEAEKAAGKERREMRRKRLMYRYKKK